MTLLNRLFNPGQPLRLAAATLLLAVAGAGTVTAVAAPHGHGGFGGPTMMGGRIDAMLERVNATPEQRSQIKAIMAAARTDLRAQHAAGKALREQTMQLFAQPTVDARAAETLRQQMLAQHDQASKRMMQAMLDASSVLTADQRKQIGEQMVQQRALMERHRAERDALNPPAGR